jgi:AcrR family transcriptional regulator
VVEEGCPFPWPAGLPQVLMRRTRPERRDAAEHRRRILEVARHLFGERGVDAVSMHQIAMAAGIGQGTLYRRYAHKGELCADLLRERHERLVAEVTDLSASAPATPALARLDGVLACLVAFLEEQGALLGPVGYGAPCDESPGSRRITQPGVSFHLWLHEVFAGLLAAAVERGELAALDVSYTADAILATIHPLCYRFQRQECGYSPERIRQGLRRIYIDGLKAASCAANEAAL